MKRTHSERTYNLSMGGGGGGRSAVHKYMHESEV